MEEEGELFEVEENDGNRDRDKFFIKEKYDTVRKLEVSVNPPKIFKTRPSWSKLNTDKIIILL